MKASTAASPNVSGNYMFRLTTIFILILPIFVFGQKELSTEIVWNKWTNLLDQGKLDSGNSKLTFYKNHFDELKRERNFYFYKDTVEYKDGSYSIGNVTIDPWLQFEHLYIGKIKSYYVNGHILSEGEYALGAYTICQSGGPSVVGYNFKFGRWKYFYDNGKLMAIGDFSIFPSLENTMCGSDTLSKSIPNAKWKFYDEDGGAAKNRQSIIDRINNCR